MGTKAERRAAQERIATYHEARLAELIEHVAAALDGYRTGEIDVYAFDEAIHQYHRAARELWKFCWSGGGGTQTEFIAHLLDHLATDGENHRLLGTGRVSTRQVITPDEPPDAEEPRLSRRPAGGY